MANKGTQRGNMASGNPTDRREGETEENRRIRVTKDRSSSD